jgi:hypothetical protein
VVHEQPLLAGVASGLVERDGESAVAVLEKGGRPLGDDLGEECPEPVPRAVIGDVHIDRAAGPHGGPARVLQTLGGDGEPRAEPGESFRPLLDRPLRPVEEGAGTPVVAEGRLGGRGGRVERPW